MEKWHATPICKIPGTKRIFGIAIEDDETAYFCGYHDFYMLNLNDGNYMQINEFSHGLGQIIWDQNGEYVYLLNRDNYSVEIFDPISKERTKVSGNGSGFQDGNLFEALFSLITDITQDSEGNLILCELTRIRKINFQKGIVETLIDPIKPGTSLAAASIDVVSDGTIYVADGNHHVIYKIQDNNSSVICGRYKERGYQDGLLHESLFEWPYQILALKNDCLMVIDGSAKDRFRIINLKRNTVSTIKLSQEVREIRCMCLDKYGTVYCGTSLGCVFKILNLWPAVRLLWIGKLKENSASCHLASMPTDIIREIMHMYVDLMTAPPKSSLLSGLTKRKRVM